MPLPKAEIRVGPLYESAGGRTQRRVLSVGEERPAHDSTLMKRGYKDAGIRFLEVARNKPQDVREAVTWASLFASWADREVAEEDAFEGLQIRTQHASD